MDPSDRNQLPCMNVPLYKSMVELNESFHAYQVKPDAAHKAKITASLDKCIAAYEEAVIFMNSPIENVNIGFGETYNTSRTISEWRKNLPTLITNVAALKLNQYSETLKNMQTDNRYQAECIIS